MSVRKTKPELYEEIRQLRKELRKVQIQAEKNNIFVPWRLKTIEVDTEEKIFKVNGENFGMGCTGFVISCDGPGLFNIRMDIDTTVRYIHYENNEIVSDRQGVPHTSVWTDNLQKGSNQLGDPFNDSGKC